MQVVVLIIIVEQFRDAIVFMYLLLLGKEMWFICERFSASFLCLCLLLAHNVNMTYSFLSLAGRTKTNRNNDSFISL